MSVVVGVRPVHGGYQPVAEPFQYCKVTDRGRVFRAWVISEGWPPVVYRTQFFARRQAKRFARPFLAILEDTNA